MHRKAHALIILPGRSESISPRHRRWLARSRWLRPPHAGSLAQALGTLGVTSLPEAQGALRLWGQTGTQPAGWVAAADPVFFEARLDHLVLHSLPALPAEDVSEIFVLLRRRLADGAPVEFTSVGACGYVRCKRPIERPIETASVSPELAQGSAPEDFLPSVGTAGAHDRLQGEIQMCLHDAEINQRREAAGMPPVNALWLWGGGVARSGVMPGAALTWPRLFANEPLFKGYWLSIPAPVSEWPGDLDACLAASPSGFVAVLPRAEPDGAVDVHLAGLRRMLQRRKLRAVTLLFADGLRVDRKRWDALRVWRRGADAPREPSP